MDALIHKKYFIGKSESGVWSSIYMYKPQSSKLEDIRGEIFSVVCLKGPSEFDLSVAGNMLLDRFHETYFDNQTDDALIALEKATISAGKYLSKLLDSEDFIGSGIYLDMMSLVLVGNIVYFVSLGDGKLFGLRDGKLAELTEALKDPYGDGVITEGSLMCKNGDVFLITTPKTKNEISLEDLENACKTFKVNNFKNRVYTNEGAISALMIRYNIDRVVEKEDIVKKDVIETRVEVAEQIENEDLTLEEIIENDRKDQLVEELDEYDGTGEVDSVEDVVEEADIEYEEIVDDVIEDEIVEDVVDDNKEIDKKKKPFNFKPNINFDEIKQKASNLFNKIKKKDKNSADSIIENVGQKDTPDDFGEVSESPKEKTYKVLLQKLKNKILGVFSKIKDVVWGQWLGMYKDGVRSDESIKKRKIGIMVFTIIIVIALIAFLIYHLKVQGQLRASNERANIAYQEALKLVNDVESKASIYAKIDDDRRLQPLENLNKALNKLESAKENKEIEDKVSALDAKIKTLTDTINRRIAVKEDSYILDFSTKFPNLEIQDFVLANKKIYLLPKGATVGSVYTVDYSGGNLGEIKINLKNPKSMTVDDGGNVFVLDESGDWAISVIDKSGNIKRLAATSSDAIKKCDFLDFTMLNNTGRLYLLNKSDKSIYYYVRSGGSYGTSTKRNTMDEYALAKDFGVIDGKIYAVIPEKGGLYIEFDKKQENFRITGAVGEVNLSSVDSFFVDGKFIYLTDSAKRRVIVLLKEVNNIPFIAQFQYPTGDKWNDLRGIKADLVNRKIFVLDKQRIYMLDMNKLTPFTSL